MIPAVCRGIVVAVCLASTAAYRIPIQASLRPEVDRRSLFGTVAGALALWGARPAPSSSAIGLSREYIDPDLQFQLKYPLEWFLSKRDGAAPAFAEKPSSTMLVIADYSTGATASVVKTSLSPLVREGMGVPATVGSSISINKFEDLLDGKGVAALLTRDRDGQLKSSFDGMQEEDNKNKRFLSTVSDCAVQGNRMDFQVKTPVLRVPKLKSARTVRDPSDVFLMAAPWVADAAPKPTPRLIRQQEYERVSRAKAFLLDSTTVVTLWVTADRKVWEDESSVLEGMLDSFEVLRRVGRRR